MPKSITILGSTGSIGTQALEIIRTRDDLEVIALSAGKNLQVLIDQIKKFKPQYVTIKSDDNKKQIQELFPEINIVKDIKELSQIKVDIFISAIVGIAGLEANLIALKNSKRVAIANKETLVSAPHLVRAAQNESGSELIPIDSEHVAIHQCISSSNNIKEILLTSSGGPFRTTKKEDLANVSLEQALNHPRWKMGPKITVDSSTLMNKGLEVIEVNSLFNIDYDQIQVVIHPESIIHSAVTFIDGNTIAQLSSTDMKVPIQYSIDYPERKNISLNEEFDIFKWSNLNFERPDLDKFPAINLAYSAGKAGGSMPTVLNSANEVAVKLFLEGKIRYLDIVKIIDAEMEKHSITKDPSLEEILGIDKEIQDKHLASVG